MQPLLLLLLLAPTSGCAASPPNAVVKHTVRLKVNVCQLARSPVAGFRGGHQQRGADF